MRCIFSSNAFLASFVPLWKRAFQYFIMRSPPPSLPVSSIILHDEDTQLKTLQSVMKILFSWSSVQSSLTGESRGPEASGGLAISLNQLQEDATILTGLAIFYRQP